MDKEERMDGVEACVDVYGRGFRDLQGTIDLFSKSA